MGTGGASCVCRQRDEFSSKTGFDVSSCFPASSAETSLLNKLIRTSLVESRYHVEVLQQDPRSPLFSVKSFEELPL